MSTEERVPNERLRRARSLKGWSQEELAAQVGTSFEMVSRWERGIVVPSPYFRERLSDALGQSAEDLGLISAPRPPLVPPPSPLVVLASSFADAEKEVVAQLKADLEARGMTVWISRQLRRQSGKQPRKALQEAIQAAQMILVVVSPDARTARHVREALQLARIYRRPVSVVWVGGERWQGCLPADSPEPWVILDVRKRYETTLLDEIVGKLEQAGPAPKGMATSSTQVPGAPAGSIIRRPNSLPAQPTLLIGREQEVAALCHLLHRSEVRLLTLTGTAGVGKTRLALAAAQALIEDFTNGLFFVPLASISESDLVAPTIAQSLGLREVEKQSFPDLLKAYLQDKQLLLLLDNFEQILSAGSLLAELLSVSPGLKLLVTSREALHLRAEHQFLVPPLALPNVKRLPGVEALPDYAAVALFTQRAQAVKPDFQVTRSNAREIAEICVRLDGLPLAIELAAARIKLLSPQALLERLRHPLQVLTGGTQDLPERQQTLRNTITWSYNLLDIQEQRLFRQLSIFVGGCTLEAVEAVCNASGDMTMNILDGVTSLLDKNLIQRVEQPGGDSRLVMLETIREYALECLTASGEAEAARRAHVAYYLAFAEAVKPKLRRAEQRKWLEQLDREHDNLRAGLTWSVEQGEAPDCVEISLRFGVALWSFWGVRGLLSEGCHWLGKALAGRSDVALPLRAKALNSAGVLALYQGDLMRGSALCGESLRLFQALGDQRGVASTLKGQALAARTAGDYTTARTLYEQSLAILRELNDKRDIASALYHAALTALFQGDDMAARSMMEEGLVLFRETEDKRGTAYSLALLGLVSLNQGQTLVARSLLEESLAVFRALEDRQAIVYTLCVLGMIVLSQGDATRARAMYDESVALLRESGEKWFITICLAGLGDVVAVQGQPAWAARLWGAAEMLRETSGTVIPPFQRHFYEQAVAAARTQLGENAFAIAWAEGRTMTPEQALSTNYLDPGIEGRPQSF